MFNDHLILTKEYFKFCLSKGQYRTNLANIKNIYLYCSLSRLFIYGWCIYNIITNHVVSAICFFIYSLFLLFLNIINFFSIYIYKLEQHYIKDKIEHIKNISKKLDEK